MGQKMYIVFIVGLLCIIRPSQAQGVCPTADGYDFYRLQEVAGAYNLGTASGAPAAIAAACGKRNLCNAFTAAGQLQIVPMAPIFSLLDGSDQATLSCDGVYVAQRATFSGLALSPDITVDKLNKEGGKKLLNMQAAVAAAKAVSKKLKDWKLNPLTANKLPQKDIDRAFKEAKTPLAQVSDVTGVYTFGDVLAALTNPDWDSRFNGTFNFVSPVKDQKSCGSCVAFAATAAAESAVAMGSKTAASNVDLSEQWLFFCNGKYSPSCSTGWYADAATDVIVRYSLPSEANYPYIGSPRCTLYALPETRPRGTFARTTINDINVAKDHIRQYGSVLTYFAVYNDFFSWTGASPPYSYNGGSTLAGYHQVLTVGYNDAGSYWIAKNSWGTGWGDKGFFRISYTNNVGFMSGSYDNIMGLSFTPADPSPPPPSPSPPSPFPPSPSPSSPSPPSPSPPSPSPPPPSPVPPSPSPSPLPPPTPPPSFPPSPPPPLPGCGDGICGPGEDCTICPQDCGPCPPPPSPIPSPSTPPPPSTPPSPSPSPSPFPSPSPLPPPSPSPFPSPPFPSPSPPPSSVCGDGVCSGNETCASCAADCGTCAVCGDGVCSGGETCLTCFADCAIVQRNGTRSCCGDSVCNAASGETGCSCQADCGVCRTCNNNGVCEGWLGEKCVSGRNGCADCGSCSGSYCGDGKCTSARKGYSESCSACPQDCGSCTDPQYCGDGVCSTSPRNENLSCSRDCKPWKWERRKPGERESGKGRARASRRLARLAA